MSKRCQMSKSQTHRLWRRFTKKIEWGSHILMSILTSNMKVTKIFQKHFHAHLEGFSSPSYVTSKLTSICVNLIMWIYFFLWTSSIVHVFDFLTTWHLFWHMGNGSHWQRVIMVNTDDRDGAPWVMGNGYMWSCAGSCATSLILHESVQKIYCT